MKYSNKLIGSETSAFSQEIRKQFGLSEVMSNIISQKGFSSLEEVELFLHPKKTQFENPFSLKGMAKLVERIKLAIEKTEKVLVFGDYDVDGIGATAIILGAFKKMGLNAEYILPSRYIDGYGLTMDLVKKIKADINPDLIITVDCGISCHAEVEECKKLGMEVIVTDHHEIPQQIPECLVVTAKFEDQDFSFNDLCGAGLALKIAQALLGFSAAEEFLPIAAISTIADMVSLTHENRAIVSFGLNMFSHYLPVGLKQFLKVSKIDIKKVLTTDISYRIAPKLNSPGRMGNAEDALALYLEKDPVKINQIIQTITNHNDERVALCNRIHEECKAMIEKIDLQENLCIVLSSPTWEQGVLGIICSRLIEELSRPVFLFSDLGEEMKGSGRSVDGLNIHEMLSSLESCIEKFGGHAMAAGLSIKSIEFENFRMQANKYVEKKSHEIVFSKEISNYEKISLNDLSPKLATELDLLEPTGMGNHLPVFLVETNAVSVLPLKNFPEHLNVSIGKNFVGIFFGGSKCADELLIPGTKSFLIEIQRPKYKTKQIRGQIKEYVISDMSKSNFASVTTKSLVFELQYFNTQSQLPKNVIMYNEKEIFELIASKMKNPFGTLIVSNSYQSFLTLKENYDIDAINHSFFSINSKNLLNSVLIAPTSFNDLSRFTNIILLDGVSSNGYLEKLAEQGIANIYLPKGKKVDCSAFFGLKTNRVFMGGQFNAFKKHESKQIESFDDLFKQVASETKTTTENAMLSYIIFKEIGVLVEEIVGGKTIFHQSQQKGNLEHSNIAAYVRENSNPSNGDCK